MNRRAFLRGAALIAAGTVAADQLEIVERLSWTRRFFPGFSRPTLWGDAIHDDTAALQAMVSGRDVYYAREDRIIYGSLPAVVYDGHFRIIGPVRIDGRRKAQLLIASSVFNCEAIKNAAAIRYEGVWSGPTDGYALAS